MQPDHVHNFQERLNQWVANQGFWFQIRHSVLGGGFGGKVMFHILRMSMRLAIFLLIFAIGSWVYLAKRTDSQKFRITLENNLRESLAVTDLAITPSRTQNNLEINRLGAEGGPGTFFSSLEARNIRCRMRLIDGLFGVWDPGVITIAQLDVDLRAGADDAESAANMAKVIFSQSPNVLVNTIDVANANLRWGYSARTRGSITSSHLKIQRTDSGWRLMFKGGYFRQNWLKDLEIIEMTVLCEPEGLFFEEARLRRGNATVDFTDMRIEAGERPMVRGNIRIKNLDLESVLPPSHNAIINGTFSSNLSVSGSTNSSEGLAFEGMVTMDGSDVITLRDRIHLLKALSVVDYSRNYQRVEFNEGSFQFKSVGGGLHIHDIRLRAEDLLSLDGEIVIRLPNDEEVRAAVQKGLFAGSTDLFGDNPETPLLPGTGDTNFTLKRAANESKRLRDGMQNPETMSLFDRLGLSLEMRKLEVEAAERLSRMLRHQGEFVITLPADAFDQAPNLRKKYPVNLDTGRIPMRVPIDGYLDEITLKQAESVYEDGQR
jgi:hypothetical protein